MQKKRKASFVDKEKRSPSGKWFLWVKRQFKQTLSTKTAMEEE